MNLLRLLEVYQPTFEEVDVKNRMIDFVQKHPDCFERHLEKGHITGSAWLISRDYQSVLLTHHAKLNIWIQLGGHCDGDPDVLKTAVREAQEESGINSIEPVSKGIFDIDIHAMPEWEKERAHFHYDVRFLLRVTSDEKFILTSESNKLQWFGRDSTKLPTQNRSILRMFEKWTSMFGKREK